MKEESLPPKKILILKLRYHGDMLLTTPLISTLKANYPNAKIDVLLYQDTMPILSANPEIHQLYGLKRKTSTLLEKIRNFTEIWQTLKQNNYDLIVNLADQWPIALLVKLLGCRSIALDRGNNLKGKIWRLFFDTCVPPVGAHIVEQNLYLLTPLKLPASNTCFKLSLHYRQEDAQSIANQRPTLLTQRYVVIQPTTRQYYKYWDNDKFAQVIDYLKTKNLEVVLTCGPSEDDLNVVRDIHSQCMHKPDMTFAGKTSFLELAALIDNAVLYIGVDSAPMHMAAALNTPLVCLFGPTDYKLWRPWCEHYKQIWAGEYQQMPAQQNYDQTVKYLSCIPAQAVIQASEHMLKASQEENTL
ncbi:lipopolysaccharide core biosynthesis glycosyl transferase rfaq [Pectobacterium atrosepticum SCRI1043]|uniref:Lipopolysaccharide core biosynthesis glycosyl transferase rfaq n=1 Tax=Pectobacterium atrosepticum (strain SCRI 1043 / ATCC BAA-672) TaxID=218491 RepID=Q6DAU2_PECAS|nr:lipopolysaccharide core heptosyltransferase RfaQ [Pectobacterium atrosepticum]GKV87470.1 lipopolysaccharide core heptosyltransferase RfaQ [Pectobacterium carotovorum subsp. carotovorum]AIA69182.1 lipopolysaccharide core heptosyltransferase RfaQ [Pectobacterium atrosepticum]AIK12086.1 lipopolysaccharide core biosynthesis glycosyl transferase rfaq [Pectobacterium atrosepticum]ATY89033.1 lipopolysaccharide core heptosyltransferase RfaQ [Pectobacterium atrosepticum]MBL0893386.1 lipopolysacchari